MNLRSLIKVKLIISCIYIAEAQNVTHGNFTHALDTCRKSGGFAPWDIINSLPFGQHQVNNCAVAKSLQLDDGESLWTHYRAEFGAYIAPFGCTEKLPTLFKESANSTNLLYECTNMCLRKQPTLNYIGIQNGECYCMADQESFEYTDCHKVSNFNSATVASVYELVNITVQKETYACMTSVLLNNSWIYDASKCSEKHQGLCTSNKKNGFEAVKPNCLHYNDTFDYIGRSFCILGRTMFKADIDQICSAFFAKMLHKIFEGNDRLTYSERFYLSSVRTFKIVDNTKFTFDNSTLSCVSLYKSGCTIILEPDRCQNINRFQCQYSSISKKQTERNKKNDTVILIAILIPLAMLLILAICFMVRFYYGKRTRKSADTCTLSMNPEPGYEEDHISTGIYDYATTLSVAVSPTRRQNMYIVSQDITLNEPINTYPPPKKDNTICPTENNEYDVTTISGRGTLQPNMTKVYTCNHVHLGINAGEYDHIRSYAEPTVTRK